MNESFDEIETWSNNTPEEAPDKEVVEETSSKEGGLLKKGLFGLVALLLGIGVFAAGYFLANGDDDAGVATGETSGEDNDPETDGEEPQQNEGPSLADLTTQSAELADSEGLPYLATGIKDHKIAIQAKVGTEEEKVILEQTLIAILGEEDGAGDITVESGVEPAPWLEQVPLILSVFMSENALEGGLALNNNEAFLDVSVPRAENQATMVGALQQVGFEVTDNSQVVDLLGPEIQFSFDGEVLDITGELPSQELIDEIESDLEPDFENMNVDVSVNPDRYAGYGYTFMDRNLAIVTPLSGFDVAISESDFNIVLSDAIAFETGSAEVQSQVVQFAERFVASPLFLDSAIEITGHTDDRGDEDDNLELSEQRAEAVANAMINAGYAEDRITTLGKGETEPIGDNETEEGRASNRRVDLNIQN